MSKWEEMMFAAVRNTAVLQCPCGQILETLQAMTNHPVECWQAMDLYKAASEEGKPINGQLHLMRRLCNIQGNTIDETDDVLDGEPLLLVTDRYGAQIKIRQVEFRFMAGTFLNKTSETKKSTPAVFDARRMTYRFMELNYLDRARIIRELELLDDRELKYDHQRGYKLAFRRAKQEGKIEALEKATNQEWDKQEAERHYDRNNSLPRL